MRTLTLLSLLLAAACSGSEMREGNLTTVTELYDDYVARRAKIDPNWASSVGIHDHDRRLTRFDDETRNALKFILADSLLKIRALNFDLLPAEHQLDYKLWRAQLETELYELDRRDERKIMPDLPLGAVDTIYVMLIKDFAPARERAENALHRLGELPKVLDDMRSKLTDPPRVWTEMAIEDGAGAIQGIDEIVRLIKGGIPDDRADKAGAAAKKALEAYVEFLKKDLLPHSTGSFALGKPIYDLYLQRYHLLRLDADALIDIGKREWDRTIAMLEACAKSIDPARPWAEILESMKKDHPAAKDLVDAYRRETAKARQFIIDKSLVSLPQDEKLEILETPAFSRSSIPYAAYQPPGPLDAARTGHFYVTPVDPGASAEEAEAQLAGHNIYDIPGTVWHEAYPGHHTQFVLAKNVTSKVRRLNPSPLLSEGWGFYCEELAHESGYFTDPRMRLMQLNWRLQRAARVILDASLHSGRMKFDEAVAFLVEKVKLEKTSAVRSARGYARNPAYFMAYMVGMLEIVRIREETRKRLGERFSLMEFHDRVLRYGNVPPGLIEGELLREWP